MLKKDDISPLSNGWRFAIEWALAEKFPGMPPVDWDDKILVQDALFTLPALSPAEMERLTAWIGMLATAVGCLIELGKQTSVTRRVKGITLRQWGYLLMWLRSVQGSDCFEHDRINLKKPSGKCDGIFLLFEIVFG